MVGSQPPPPPKNADGTQADAPLIADEARSHHFGAVISGSGKKLKHAYRLANATNHEIKFVDLVNRKPCCGDVRIGTTTLRPGDLTEVEVTISIRQEFGEIVHDTAVLTEPAEPEELVLRTMATAYPPVRIEEESPVKNAVLLRSDKPKSVDFRVFVYGSSTEPPVDLDRIELRSTIKVKWLGPKQAVTSDGDPTVETRQFTALLDPAGLPGERKSEIVLQDDKQTYYTHRLTWHVIPVITAAPKLIVMKPGKRDYRVLIQSRDQRQFRIMRVESKVPGIQGRAVNAAAALTQLVEVEAEDALRKKDQRGHLTVFTDHPDHGQVDLPFVVIR